MTVGFPGTLPPATSCYSSKEPDVDTYLARSLLMFTFGLGLIMLGLILDPPLRLMVAINPEWMD